MGRKGGQKTREEKKKEGWKRQRGKGMKTYRRNWLTGAGEISQEVEKFIEDEKNAKKSCFFKLCPNLISRHQLNRQAKKKGRRCQENPRRDCRCVGFEIQGDEQIGTSRAAP